MLCKCCVREKMYCTLYHREILNNGDKTIKTQNNGGFRYYEENIPMRDIRELRETLKNIRLTTGLLLLTQLKKSHSFSHTINKNSIYTTTNFLPEIVIV